MLENLNLEEDCGDIEIPVLPEGKYPALLTKCTLKESKNGDPMIESEFSIGVEELPLDFEPKSVQTLKNWVVYKSDNIFNKKAFGDFLKVVGLPTKGAITQEMLLSVNGTRVILDIVHQDYNDSKVASIKSVKKSDTPM